MSVLQLTRPKTNEAEPLTTILNAHGGLERWNKYTKVEATVVSGGGFYPLKGVLPDTIRRRTTVWLHEQRSSVMPYGAPDQRTMFTPDRIAIEKLDGTLVAERKAPRDSFAGHQMHTPLDALLLVQCNRVGFPSEDIDLARRRSSGWEER